MAAPDPETEKFLARQSRRVGFVIAATAVVWIMGNWLGPKVGLDGKYAVLLDLCALAAFTWSLIVTWAIWRKRREN